MCSYFFVLLIFCNYYKTINDIRQFAAGLCWPRFLMVQEACFGEIILKRCGAVVCVGVGPFYSLSHGHLHHLLDAAGEEHLAAAPVGDTTADRQNFGKMLLVFGCIGTDFCKKIRVFQHFSKSTRLSS